MNIDQVTNGHYLIEIEYLNVRVDLKLHNSEFIVSVPYTLYGKNLQGLCGDCNNNPEDDFKLDTGTIIHEEPQFVKTWEIPYNTNVLSLTTPLPEGHPEIKSPIEPYNQKTTTSTQNLYAQEGQAEVKTPVQPLIHDETTTTKIPYIPQGQPGVQPYNQEETTTEEILYHPQYQTGVKLPVQPSIHEHTTTKRNPYIPQGQPGVKRPL